MRRRVLYAGLFHETHTFLEEVTRWEDFEVLGGDAILSRLGDGSPADGFLEEAGRQDWEVVPTIDARAAPGGTVDDAAFETYWSQFERRARPALAAGVDALYLVLHGAMATRSCDDVEGELLARIRALPGAADRPIFGVLDLHANVSARMCALANGLVTYRENPHTDAKETARRAAVLLGRCLWEGRVPRMYRCRPPLMWAPPGTGTDADPMFSLENFARKVEAADPGVWACNVAAGYSFADTAETGMTLSLVATVTATQAREHLEAGARLAWALRAKGTIEYPPVDDVAARLKAESPSVTPVLLVEPSDNIGGGAPGDGTGVLRAFLRHGLTNALVVINDPAAVAELASLRPGETRTLRVGGRGSRLDAGPVEIEATLLSRRSGEFALEDPQSHLASMTGVNIHMGPCAVVRSRGVTLLLTSRKTPPFDLGQLRSQGLEPRDFTFIGVKAAVAHRRAYDPLQGLSYYVDTPGPCTGNLAALPWRRLRRPVYPLDPIHLPEFKIT